MYSNLQEDIKKRKRREKFNDEVSGSVGRSVGRGRKEGEWIRVSGMRRGR